MNTPRKAVVVSASLAIIAAQAMVTAAKKSDGILNIQAKSGEKSDLRQRIDAVVAQRDTKVEISSFIMLLASKLTEGKGEGDISLAQKYFPKEYLVAAAAGDDFSGSSGVTTPPNVTYPGVGCHSACYSNCHSACHGACHGSRGWR